MSWEEQMLLTALLAFVAGVALGRSWERLAARAHPEHKKRFGESIHFILGLDYLASRQIDKAIAELTRAARANTEAVEIYLILGNLLREKGQLERAIQIHQSILHRPGIAPQERAHALLCLGMDFKQAGFRNRAVETFEEVVRLDPSNPYALLHLLKIQEEEKNWRQALDILQKLDASTNEAHSTLTAFLHDQIGQSALAGSDHRLARQSFETAIRYDPKLPPPYLHLGDLLDQEGNLSEAILQWEALIHEAPEHAYLAFGRLESAYEKRGEPEKLDELYRQVMKRDRKDWRAHIAMARRWAATGKSEQAFDLLLAAAENNPHAIGSQLEAWELLLTSGAPRDVLKAYIERVRQSVFFLDPHICTKCHYRANGVLWRCPHCQEWNTFVEERWVAPEYSEKE